MATYDLAYPGAAIDAILNTAYYLQEAGYIFQGSASEYSGTPSKRVWLIAPAGFTGLGLSSAVPQGSIGVCLYTGTAWVGKIINVLTLDSAPTRNSQNGVTSGGVADTLDEIAGGIMETFASLLFDDETAAGDLSTKLSYAVKFSVSDVYQTVTHLNILAATTSKAGLMSAEDKAKVDSFLTNLRSLTFTDTTASADQATQITETLKATIGGVHEVIDSITLLAATSSKAGLLSASDKAYIDALPATLTSLSNSISGALALMQSLVGYYVCDTAAGTAAKTVAATGYSLTNGGCIRIKMTNTNTAANATLNINSTGAKALYYDGAQASSTNTWEAGEVLEVYYDGTQYQCASGGGGSADRVKYDNTGSGLSADNVQDAIDEISDDTEQLMNEVYGEPTQQTGTWGAWASGTSAQPRIFVICDQLSVLDGVISVRLRDYSTYRFGIVIQRGTAWSSSVVSDTGWKTADFSKIIAANEVGYNIKVSLSRIDNGAISPSDAASIISSLSYTYTGDGGEGIISSINDLNAKLGYYECTTVAGTAAKTVAATGYKLTDGGCIRIKMTNGNTADNVTLNINGTGAEALFYNGEQASSTNTWKAGDVLEVYYDGTQYQSYSPLSFADELAKMDDAIFGIPQEPETGTWEEWQLSTSSPYRVFSYCVQLAALGGVVRVKLNDYSTYRLGIGIYRGKSWSSQAISDTGWKTEDTTKVIAENEVGYYIRVNLGRVNNTSMTLEEVATALKSIEYIYIETAPGLMYRMDEVEDAVFGSGNYVYSGSRVILKDWNFSANLYMTLNAPTGKTGQGGGVYGKYFIQGGNGGYARVYDLETKEIVVSSMELAVVVSTNHVNNICFSELFPTGNEDFPYMYVSECNGDGRCFVENFKLTGSTLVQTLSYNGSDIYQRNWVLDYKRGYIYLVGNTTSSGLNVNNMFKVMKFSLPLPTAGDVVFTASDILDSYEYSGADGYARVFQGNIIKNGKMYSCFGGNTTTHRIWVTDLDTHEVLTSIELDQIYGGECESINIWNNSILVGYPIQGRLYQLTF